GRRSPIRSRRSSAMGRTAGNASSFCFGAKELALAFDRKRRSRVSDARELCQQFRTRPVLRTARQPSLFQSRSGHAQGYRAAIRSRVARFDAAEGAGATVSMELEERPSRDEWSAKRVRTEMSSKLCIG